MAHQVTKHQILRLPQAPSAITPEQKYWKSFKSPQNFTSQSPVTHISFPPYSSNPLLQTNNDHFVVTTGTRVQIYSIRTRALVKAIARFSDIAHSGEIRRDGRVLVAGDDTGKIQVFDVGSRAILKTWTEHKQPVWTTKFSPTDVTTLMSTSDDRTVRLWDLPSEESQTTFLGHEDYVRCGLFLPGSGSNMLVTGSYDQTVRVWDPRVATRSVMTFKHAAPVESVVAMPSGTQVLAAADNQISVLDLVAGKPLNILKSHQKTVTSLCLATNSTRLVSGSLDGHLKVFETSGWNVVAGSKYPSAILSLNVVSGGAKNEDTHVVVGMQSGVLSIRTKLRGQQKVREKERRMEMKALLDGTLDEHDKKQRKRSKAPAKKLRGLKFMGESADVVIEGIRSQNVKERPWEKNLRQGEFAKALDLALNDKSTIPVTILSILTELRHRSALRLALQDRDEESVQPIFKWVIKHIADPRFVDNCVDTALTLLDLYSPHVFASPELGHLVKQLHLRVRREVESAQYAWKIKGMIDMLMVQLP